MEQIQQFNPLLAQITEFVSPAKLVKVTDASTATDAVEMGKQVKLYLKKTEDLRKALVKPLNDQAKAINEHAKMLADPLEQAETHLKRELGRYADEQEAIRKEELRKLEEKREAERVRLLAEATVQKAEAEPEAAVGIDVANNIKFQAASAGIRREEKRVESTAISNVRRPWKAELQNESEIPREYLSVDMKKINEAIRAGVREIPGVRIFQETTVAFAASTAVPAAALTSDYFGDKK